MAKKIAFINAHKHPSTTKVLELLKEKFPENEIQIFQLDDMLYRRPLFLIVNVFYIFKEYWKDFLLRRKKLMACFFLTTYTFKQVRKIMKKQLNSGDFLFSFQIGSLFDTSIKKIPHFIYTDNTYMARYLSDPVYHKYELPTEKWIKLEKTIYANSTLNFTRSSNVTNSIISYYNTPPGKVICVYAGSNAAEADEQSFDDARYQKKEILFVATSWERKGGVELFEAFKEICVEHPDAVLTIVGVEPNIEHQNINIVGLVKPSELKKYYQRASIFCLPTKTEAFGIVFVEAMSYKLPVIATNIAAIPDMVKNDVNGYLIEPGNANQIKNSLLKLLSDPQKCKDFGEAGFKHAKNLYTWDKVGENLFKEISGFLN